MNENRLSRVLFNNKSCRLRGAANAVRTRNCMASEVHVKHWSGVILASVSMCRHRNQWSRVLDK
jgi:hypothetical protein